MRAVRPKLRHHLQAHAELALEVITDPSVAALPEFARVVVLAIVLQRRAAELEQRAREVMMRKPARRQAAADSRLGGDDAP